MSLARSVLTGSTCNNYYTAANTLLDVYISGCKAYGIIPEINPTQPDSSRDSATYTFQVGTGHHITGCKRNNVTQSSLTGCLANAGYTSLFQFTTDRVIGK